MKFLSIVLTLFLIFSCSDKSTNSNNDDGNGITNNFLSQLYIGSISIEYSGGYSANVNSDTVTATAIKQAETGNIYVTFYESALGLAFVGQTNGTNQTLTFIDSTTTPGTIIGTVNNDDILLISQSGEFKITTLNSSKFQGTFSGVFTGYTSGNNQAVTANVSATYNFHASTGLGKTTGIGDYSDKAEILLNKALKNQK